MRIVIAEDSAILREGLAQLLTVRGHEVLAAVEDVPALFEAVAAEPPDVAIVDIRMPPSHTDEGLRAAVRLRRDWPGTGVLIFSQYVETAFVAELLASGSDGVGYLLKERVAKLDDFVDALHRVAAGGTALDPDVVTQLFGRTRHRDLLAELTPREREVLALMAQGRTNTAIAAAIRVTERAVEKHVTNIFGKFDLPPSDTDHRRVLAVIRYLQN
ncbi:DNA-binding NarL/FixJ family response regulator [Actinoplanes campanulatus]|uniref:DNA-binding NarL/FixJ family response regulator n=1 Tax=Actinoplanes campanulatus TaxID=113559 RepID=A0A7W5FEP8_9ACTN|nr:response regulator transcription factor [Actinoplanes campanulatus]MBB3095621.1 DNA-binding NarL/FixJ family response regulator [Actinoplanes campanulatus]GGN10327.1 DNA-binding response regulator [Actinoplanes campanulatus]GID36515.1 DNA-binding response regulator [Actinoplanes campanulatus]